MDKPMLTLEKHSLPMTAGGKTEWRDYYLAPQVDAVVEVKDCEKRQKDMCIDDLKRQCREYEQSLAAKEGELQTANMLVEELTKVEQLVSYPQSGWTDEQIEKHGHVINIYEGKLIKASISVSEFVADQLAAKEARIVELEKHCKELYAITPFGIAEAQEEREQQGSILDARGIPDEYYE